MRRIVLGLMALSGVFAFTGCTRGPVNFDTQTNYGSYLPTSAWLDGPPEPMQVIDNSLSRMLLAVPADLDRGMRYKAGEAREIYVQRLNGGAILYSRYADPAYIPAGTNFASMVDALYKGPLNRRVGESAHSLGVTRMELPFGPTWMLDVEGQNQSCTAFVAPIRVGSKAPAGAYDAMIRGSLCKDAVFLGDSKADLVKILRSLVLRE